MAKAQAEPQLRRRGTKGEATWDYIGTAWEPCWNHLGGASEGSVMDLRHPGGSGAIWEAASGPELSWRENGNVLNPS